MTEVHPSAIVYPGTVLGEGVKVLEGAVVGKQPTLAPGESFEYTSGWPLPAPFGVLQGTYQMITALGERFDAKVAPVALSEPYTVH